MPHQAVARRAGRKGPVPAHQSRQAVGACGLACVSLRSALLTARLRPLACKASRRPQGRAREANGGLTISRRGIWDWDDLPGLLRANADALAWRPCRARSVSPFPVIRCSRANPISRFLRQCSERPNGPLQLSDPRHHGELYPLQRGPSDRSGRGRAAAKAFGVGSAPVKLTAPRSQRQARIARLLQRRYCGCV